MTDWSKYPFVRMLIPFALGIWVSIFVIGLRLSPTFLIAASLSLLVMAMLTAFLLKHQRHSWFFGAVMACYLFMAGYSLVRVHGAEVQKSYYRSFQADASYYVARVYDYPTERPNSIRTVLELEYQFCDSLPSRPVSGKVMAYFPKSDSAFALHYGDLIAIPAPIREVSPPLNPEEFDYRAYLARKGITGQTYLKDDDWIDLQVNDANPIYAFSYRFRDVLLTSLQRSGLNDDEFGVAAAILLGYDDNLADEVRKDYVAAGSMHILCVSGMHVGIIYLLASFLLGFLNRKKWQKMLKEVLLLALIWFYALIAGLSPSILRASLMISFVIIGEAIHRKGFVINSIAASAFILLCINPNNLFEIGFLLSYAAVMGIVVLQRPIYNLLYVKNKLLDKAWQITAVALSAQIATIPFTLFYFQQFTTYFWLSNLFMTPISFIVVISGMILLLVSWIPYLNTLVGYLVWGAVYVMNWVVAKIESIPYSIIKGLYVNDFEFAVLLVALLLLMLTFMLLKRRLFIAMLASLLVVMASVTIRMYNSDHQQGMTIFSLRNHTAIDYIRGGEHVLLADSALMADESTVDYSLKGAWSKRHLSYHPQVVGLEEDYANDYVCKKSNLVTFDGKLLAIWEDQRISDSLSFRLPVDYLLIVGKQKPNVQSIVNGYEAKLLLIDGSVPRYLAEKWIAQAQDLDIPYYNIGEGAMEVGYVLK
ncbi:MAG: competence protein ComEC family protein [Bacteroidales bacterium]|nr:competence protein ComEC family protein [Bacteroidales bacterium]